MTDLHRGHPRGSRIGANPLDPASPICSEVHAAGGALRDAPQVIPGAAAPAVWHYVDLAPLWACLQFGYQLGARAAATKFPVDSSTFNGAASSPGHSQRPAANKAPSNRSDPTNSIDPSLLAADPGIGPSTSRTAPKGKEKAVKKNSKKRSRKQTGDGSSDGDSEDGDGPGRSDPPERGTTDRQQSYACPFLKLDPLRYHQSCSGKRLENINRVKQHIKRSHVLPQHYCTFCWTPSENIDALREHMHPQRCQWKDPRESDPFTLDEAESGILNTTSGLSNEERWNELWCKLFPLHACDLPSSPYDEPLLSQLESLAKTMTEEVPGLMEQHNVPLENRAAFQLDLLALIDRNSNPVRRFRLKPPPQARHAMRESPSIVFGPGSDDMGHYIGRGEYPDIAGNTIETADPQWDLDWNGLVGGHTAE